MSGDSIRKRILQALVTSFEDVVAGEPIDDPYPFQFDLVTRAPLGSLKVGLRAALGIYSSENPKVPLAAIVMQNSMSISLEAWLNKNLGEDLPDLLEDAMYVLERRLMEDQTLGGLCMDINVTGLTTDIDGPADNQAAGRLEATIMYRHHRDNPALEVGE